MAVSSIVEKIRVNNPKVIEEYVAAMESSERALIVRKQQPTVRKITDPEELKKVMLRGIEKWEKK